MLDETQNLLANPLVPDWLPGVLQRSPATTAMWMVTFAGVPHFFISRTAPICHCSGCTQAAAAVNAIWQANLIATMREFVEQLSGPTP